MDRDDRGACHGKRDKSWSKGVEFDWVGRPGCAVWQDRAVDVIVTVQDDGQVDARLPAGWPIFNDALRDSISSLPPRGAVGNGPSTYWIDRAEQGAREARRAGDERPFLWGNTTVLRVDGDSVVASDEYAGDPEPEAMPLAEFLALLKEWRRRVVGSAATAARPLPETYRRNSI